MTKEEYEVKLNEHGEGQRVVYYNALNKFNANVVLTQEERRFVKGNTETFDFDQDGSIEDMEAVIASVKTKKVELNEDFNNKNIKDYYEITAMSDGYDDSSIDECYFAVTWDTIRSLDDILLGQGQAILRDSLQDALGVSYVYPNSKMQRMFLAGTITWDIFVDGHRR